MVLLSQFNLPLSGFSLDMCLGALRFVFCFFHCDLSPDSIASIVGSRFLNRVINEMLCAAVILFAEGKARVAHPQPKPRPPSSHSDPLIRSPDKTTPRPGSWRNIVCDCHWHPVSRDAPFTCAFVLTDSALFWAWLRQFQSGKITSGCLTYERPLARLSWGMCYR